MFAPTPVADAVVEPQGLVAALRALESQLAEAVSLTPCSFTCQALSGMLFKALVPLLPLQPPLLPLQPSLLPLLPDAQHHRGSGTHYFAHHMQGGAGLLRQQGEDRSSGGSIDGSSGADRLLRLLRLPAGYDPRVLPEGRQVLPPPPGVASHLGQQTPPKKQQQQEKQLAVTADVKRTPCKSSEGQCKQEQQQSGKQCEGTCRHAGAPAGVASCNDTHPDRNHHQQQPQHGNPHFISCHPKLALQQDPTAAAAPAPALAAGGVKSGGKGADLFLPLHLPVEKEGVRLQASGEAEFTGDVADKRGGDRLYLAGVLSGGGGY